MRQFNASVPLMASSTACAIQHRQRPGQTEANRADIAIGWGAEAGGASAKNLGRGGELHVDFEPHDSLVARDGVRRGRS